MLLGGVAQQAREMAGQGHLPDAGLRLWALYLAEHSDALVYSQHGCIKVEAAGA